MKKNRLFILVVMFVAAMWANMAGADVPGLKHVFDIRAEIDGSIQVGDIPKGRRVVIPITGGTVSGEISGRILPGGADYQIVDTLHKRCELRAIYTVMTDDSVFINVVNEGVNSYGDDYYFMTSPKFECDMSSPYAWLNNRVFVCRPVEFGDGFIVLRVWMAR